MFWTLKLVIFAKILDDIPTETEDEVEDSGIGTEFGLPKGYDPNAYLKEVNIKWPKQRQIEEVRIGSTVGAQVLSTSFK